jgi:cell division septal protein FtsQ
MAERRTTRRKAYRVRSPFIAAFCGTLALAIWSVHQPVWAALRTHPYFAVKDLRIEGAGPLLSQEEILAWVGIDERAAIWDLPPVRVQRRLEAHPLIAEAAIYREFPDRFEIEIRERRPEAIAALDQLYYIDREGTLLRALSPRNNPDFPIVTGLTPETPPGYRSFALRRAQRLLRLCERMSCLGGISEVHLDSERGVVVYPVTRRVQVTLGWGSWRQKLRRAEQVLDEWRGHAEQLAGIDLRFRNQAVVRVRKAAEEPQAAKKTVRKPPSAKRSGVGA